MSEEPTGGEGSSPARAGEAARVLMASEKLVYREKSRYSRLQSMNSCE